MRSLGQKYGFQAVLIVPLLANDKSLGTLIVMDKRARRFTDDEISLLTAFADQASLALEKARLLNEAEARERQAIQLYEVTTQLASNHDLESVLDLITEQAVELSGGRGGMILRYDEAKGGLVVATMHNIKPEIQDVLVRPGEGNAGRAYAERRAVWTNDLMGDSSVVYSDEDSEKLVRGQGSDFGVVGVVAAPIMIQDEVYGILDVLFDKHREFTAENINLVQNLADSAAVAINNARFIAETQQARDEAEGREKEATQLQEVTAQLASSQDLDGVLELIATKAVELLGCQGSAIFEYDPVRGGLVAVKTQNFLSEMVQSLFFRPGEGTPGTAFQQRKPIWTTDRFVDPSFANSETTTETAARNAGVRGAASVPIIIRGEPYGVLNILFFELHDFTDGEIQLLQTLADSAAVAIGNARFIEETQQARDVATKLYEITEQLASSPDMDSVLDLIAAKAAELLGSYDSSILKFDEATGLLSPAGSFDRTPELLKWYTSKPGDGASGLAYQDRRPVWTSDITSDESLYWSDPDALRVLKATGTKACLSVPVVVRDEPYGTLNVVYLEVHDFTNAEIRLLSTLADSAAVAIGNAGFIEQTQQARDEAETREREATQLREVTAQLASSQDMDTVLDLITEKTVEILRCDWSTILKYEEAKGGLVLLREHNFPYDLRDVVFNPGEGLARAFQERRPIRTRNMLDDSLANYVDPSAFDRIRNSAQAVGVGAALATPIVIRDEPYGTLAVAYTGEHEISDGEVQLLQALADIVAVAIGNARFIEETQQARDAAEQANRTKSKFLANMSH
ncbi:MAG: GAF domain-containing protein, partial [Dehalococcoidia bacterium]